MKTATSTRAGLQADALVQEIGQKVAEQQRTLLDDAAREAEQIRHRAHVKARRQLRRAIQEMRVNERQHTLQVRAELDTATRRQASARALEALAAAWPRLSRAIERRWGDKAARSRWLAAQIAMARSRLPATGWVLSHPAAWSDAERSALSALLRGAGVADATLRGDADLHIGLVIEAGGVRLDSTPRALLTDRSRVESALLARLDPGKTGATAA